MQRSWLILCLSGPLITISAASPTLQTVNTSLLDLSENGILAAGSSNNATLRVDSDTFPALNSSNSPIRCYAPPLPPDMVVINDYYRAVDKILVREDAMIPREWYPGPMPSQRVTWTTGTCRIELWAEKYTRTPPFPVIYIAHAAAVIARECLTEAHGYRGGFVIMYDLGNAQVNVEAPKLGMDGPTAQM